MSSLKNKFLEAIGVKPLTPDQKLALAKADFQRKRDMVLAESLFLEAAGAEVKPLQDMLTTADDAAEDETIEAFQSGLNALKTHKKVASKIEKALSKSGKSDKKQQLYMNKYLNKKDRLEKEIKELKQQAGTGPAVAEFELMIANADKLAKPKGGEPNYVDAYGAMAGFGKKRKKAQTDAASAINKLPDDGDSAPKDGTEPLTLQTTFKDTEKALDSYWDLAPDSVVEQEQTAAYDLLEQALTAQRELEAKLKTIPKTLGKNKAKEAERLKFRNLAVSLEKKLTAIKERVEREVQRLQLDKNSCDANNDQINIKRNQLLPLVVSAELGSLDQIVADGRRLLADKQFGLALTKLREADRKLNDDLLAARAKKKKWDDLPHGQMLKDLSTLALSKAVAASVGPLAEKYKALAEEVKLTRKFEEGALRFPPLRTALDQLQTNKGLSESDGVVAARKKSNKALKGLAWLGLEKALDDLKKAVKEKGGKGEDLGTWATRAAGIKAAWEGASDTALQVADVELGQKTAEDAVVAFVKSVQEFLSNPTAVKGFADGEATRAKQKLYDAKRTEGKTKLDELEVEFGGAKFKEFQKTYKEIDASSADNFETATGKMVLLISGIISANVELSGSLLAKRQEVTNEGTRLGNLIKALPAGKAFKEFTTELKGDLADITALARDGNMEVCVNALNELAELEKRITRLSQGSKKTRTNPSAFQEVRNKLKTIKSKITGEESLKSCRKARRAELLAQLKQKQTDAFANDPEESLADLGFFEEAVDNDILEAQGAKALRLENTNAARAVSEVMYTVGITELTPAGTKSAYYADLRKRIDAAVKKSNTENSEAEAQTDLAALDTEVRNYEPLKGEAKIKALAGREKQLIDGGKKAEEDKQKFEADLKDFDHVLDELKTALDVPDSDPELYDAVAQLRKQAVGLAKAGDHAEALNKLKEAKDTADAAMKNPQGRKLDSRAKLPVLAKQWGSSVTAFRKAVTDLANSIKTWGESTTGVDVAKTNKGAEAIRKLGDPALFDATVFDKVVGILTEGSNPAPTRKAAREEGLAIIRRYRGMMLRDKLILEAQDNPFLKGFLGAVGNLSLRLNSLELIIVTCV